MAMPHLPWDPLGLAGERGIKTLRKEMRGTSSGRRLGKGDGVSEMQGLQPCIWDMLSV